MKHKSILIFTSLLLLSCGQKTGGDAFDGFRMDRSRLNIGSMWIILQKGFCSVNLNSNSAVLVERACEGIQSVFGRHNPAGKEK